VVIDAPAKLADDGVFCQDDGIENNIHREISDVA
jgi:hypothetical protein